MKKADVFLSIVVPVYNEEERIFNLFEIVNFFKKRFASEVIVVNDGSTDKTLKLLKNLQKKLKFRIISYSQNYGKGFALKKGVLSSAGNYILFTDIDLSTPLVEFRKFLPHASRNHVIIATRKHKKAIVSRHQSFIRESLGKGFTNLSNLILGLNLSDFTCGFKVFSKEAAYEIFKKVTINRWGYDCEVLFLAQKMGFRVKEIPVVWVNDSRSKVKFPQDLINSFLDLLRIRVNYFLKKY